MEETQEPDQHEEVTINNYVPGSALAAIDAKIAHMDALFKRLLQSAAKYVLSEIIDRKKVPIFEGFWATGNF